MPRAPNSGMAIDWDQLLETLITSPAEVEADGLKTKARSIDELLKLRDAIRADEALANGGQGFRITKLVPPGAT